MVSRAGPRTIRQQARAAAPPSALTRPLAGKGERILFSLSLITFGVVIFYAAMVSLTRVTPALFKGQELYIPVVTEAASMLPDPVRPAPPGADSVFNRRINLLVMGVDKRSFLNDEGIDVVGDDAAPFHTDTLMVLTMDPVSKTISGVSFPRDMVIEIHSPLGYTYEDRINASYAEGYNVGKTVEAGAEQLVSDIEANFPSISIDRWVWMDFKDVEKLVDLVGGVTIDVPEELAIYDWYYTDDDVTNPTYITIPPGPNELDGYHAVAFGRNREPDDFSRIKRQQLVLRAALSEVFSANILANNPNDLWDTYAEIVRHNIPLTEMVSYLPLLRETGGTINLYSVADPVIGSDGIERQTMLPYTDPQTGAALLQWDRVNVEYWINQAFTKSRYANSTVEIQNGGGANGVPGVERLAQYLQYEQYLPEIFLGTDVALQQRTSIILITENRRPMAEDIADWLGIPRSEITTRQKTSDTQPDVIIIVGQAFNPSTMARP
jgi:LCP family protein required for cell wall assembly